MVKEKLIPFPQANNVKLMIDLLIAIALKGNQKEMPNIVPRQIQYYKKALQYFEMLDNKDRVTLKGKYILEERSISEQNRMFRNLIIAKPVFKEVEEYINLTKQMPTIEIISRFIGNYYSYNDTTLRRRANAVISIFKYLEDLKKGDI